jgi:hypothetical protein
LVQDRLLANEEFPRARPAKVRLHWLLPDLPWKLLELSAGVGVQVETTAGSVQLIIRAGLADAVPAQTWQSAYSLARAGELLAGSGRNSSVRGWWAPTYGVLQPALSIAIELLLPLPFSLVSEWRLESRAG